MTRHIAYLVQGMGTGGLERVVLLLAREMVRRGHTATICCYDLLGQLVPAAKDAGVRVEVVQRRPGVDAGYVLRLARWLRDQRADVLHMHNSTALFYGTLAGRMAGVPCLIYTEHDGVFPRGRAVQWLNRCLVRRLTHAVAVSEAVKHLWYQHDGIDPSLIRVVPNGVPAADAALSPRRLGADGVRIGSVGRLSPEKGYDVLIEAFGLARKRMCGATLALVGDGAQRQALEAQAAELGLTDCVHFLGERSDISDLLAGFDVFVLPSRSEGLPLALLEAMSAGLPIVATRVGGVPEALGEGEGGVLVPPENPCAMAEAMVGLAADAELQASLGNTARARFDAQFGLSRMVDAYEILYAGPP